MKKITHPRWGIIATGGIATKFVESLNFNKSVVRAVASRDFSKAKKFARKWKIPQSYGNYQELINDPEVDVVYIATPHTSHYDLTLASLQAGKHVLCEKPLTLNATQMKACLKLAGKKKLFLMEAVWMRFFPTIVKVKEWVDKKVIGDLVAIEADFWIDVEYDPKHRLFNPQLGGGALLDLGIYPISFALLMMQSSGQKLRKITSTCEKTKSKVDGLSYMNLHFDRTRARLSCSSLVDRPNEAFLVGSKGTIKLHSMFHCTDKVTVFTGREKAKEYNFPFLSNGYVHEIQEVEKCLKQGRAESELLPLRDSLKVMEVMDKLREEWGIKYPGKLEKV